MKFEFQNVAGTWSDVGITLGDFGERFPESEKEKKRFPANTVWWCCDQGHFRRLIRGDADKMYESSDKESPNPLPLVGMILRVKRPVNMFVLKMRVPRQRVW
ncbi:unnamed protein product [Prunus armeniaca]